MPVITLPTALLVMPDVFTDGDTDGRTDGGLTDGDTDGRTDGGLIVGPMLQHATAEPEVRAVPASSASARWYERMVVIKDSFPWVGQARLPLQAAVKKHGPGRNTLH